MCELCKNIEWPPLQGKSVVLATTGSISIYRIPDLVRELVRNGANVHVGMSSSSMELVSSEVMKWASGNDPITKITGRIEHISLFESDEGNTVLVIAPASYNTVGKMVSGIADSIPSLFFSYAYGKKIPVIIAPAMHRNMFENPIFQENLKKLLSLGVDVVHPLLEADKAKISENEKIMDHIYRAFFGNLLSGKRILIVSGRSEDLIDPVRVVTNRSTGTAGLWLARNAYRLGARRIVFVGNAESPLPEYVEQHIEYETEDFYSQVENLLTNEDFDIVIVPAAITDFYIKGGKLSKKMDSDRSAVIHLEPREKLLIRIRRKFKGKLVAFRLWNSPDNIMKHFSDSSPDMIVFNRIGEKENPFGNGPTSYTIFSREGETEITGIDKEEATFRLMIHISQVL